MITVVIKCSELGALMGKSRWEKDVMSLKAQCIDRARGKKQETELEKVKKQLKTDVNISKIVEKMDPKDVDEAYRCVNKMMIYDFGSDQKVVTDYVRHRVNTLWGIKNERNSIDRLGSIFGSLVRKTMAEREIGVNGEYRFVLRGKMDVYDIDTDTVIEIKNRIRHFYVSEHEVVQLKAYMWLYDCNKGALVQDCKSVFDIKKYELNVEEFVESLKLLVESDWG
jgi:hypothetical protein